MAITAYITKIEKSGTIITATVEGKKPITYDMTTHNMKSYTGRRVIKFPITVANSTSLSHVETLIYLALRNATDSQCIMLEKLERYLSYPELLETVENPYFLPELCPKGFVKWLKTNNKPLNNDSLIEFKEIQALKYLTQEDKQIYKMLCQEENSPFSKGSGLSRDYLYDFTPEYRKKFNQILKASLKSISWELKKDIINFNDQVYHNITWSWGEGVVRPDNWVDLLDTNRNFAYNLKMLKEIGKKERARKIIEMESKILPIEKLSNEQYTIVVPKTLDDFSDEGKQQNNCVGYFYHESIAKGENVVYFIRKTSNPKHSYITNRFNIDAGKTTETKMVNNHRNDDDMTRTLIDIIDIEIRALLNL